MLLLLTEYLAKFYSGFHVFQYLTLRGILAAVTALLMALFIGPAHDFAAEPLPNRPAWCAATVRNRICKKPARPPWAAV